MARSKKPKQIIIPSNAKKPMQDIKLGSYYNHSVSFSFRKYDSNAPWATSSDGKPSVDHVFNNLRGVEGMQWSDVVSASGGKSKGTNNHYISSKELSKEAIRRMELIRLEEDELFSLRTQGDVRLWGIIDPENGCFFVIWYDPKHKVYPVSR